MWEKRGKSPRKINQSTHYEMSHWHCVMHVGEGTSYYTRPEIRKQCTSYHTDDLFYLLYNQSHVTLALKSQKSIHSILKSALSCLGPRIFRIFWQTNGKLSRTTSDDSCLPVARKKTGETTALAFGRAIWSDLRSSFEYKIHTKARMILFLFL